MKSLATADIKLLGDDSSDQVGNSVSGAGDVDGDGLDDLLIGADGDEEGGDEAGAAYLVLGGVSGTLSLSDAHAYLIGEASGDAAGYAVSGAGDVDGDGLDDLLIGAPSYDGIWQAGKAYLVLGGLSGTLDLSGADAQLLGKDVGDYAGLSVSGAGDVDGDGLDDLLIGAPGEDGEGDFSGGAYVVRGTVSGSLPLASADTHFLGEESEDFAGGSVAGAGDVDGDGWVDLLIGAPGNDEGGDEAGAAYLVRGGVSGTISLADADAKFLGEQSEDEVGNAVAGAGDVNGDGWDAALIGAYARDEAEDYNVGGAYLLWGGDY